MYKVSVLLLLLVSILLLIKSKLNFQTYEASKLTENISEIFFSYFWGLACISKTFLKCFLLFVFQDLLASRKHLWNIFFWTSMSLENISEIFCFLFFRTCMPLLRIDEIEDRQKALQFLNDRQKLVELFRGALKGLPGDQKWEHS